MTVKTGSTGCTSPSIITNLSFPPPFTLFNFVSGLVTVLQRRYVETLPIPFAFVRSRNLDVKTGCSHPLHFVQVTRD